VKHAPGPGGILRHHLLGKLESNPKGHEALLTPIVQIALDAAALVVRRGQDAGPRLPQLRQ